MSFFGLNFGQNADIDIILDNQDERKMGEIKDENGRKERLPLFYDGESVTGKVNVTLHRKTNRLEHHGIKIEFIGQIELYYDRGNHHEFLSLVKELARPGELTQNTSFEFEFNQVEKPYECYTGANVRLRYFLRVTVVRRLTDMQKELDLLVHTLATYPEMNNPIKMEVGIEECLHIEFEYNKSKYHLKDVIVGKIYFLLVRIKIRYMEVAIIKRETTGSGPNTFHDNETIAKYEIMDGAPVKGESIPIRVFLAGYDLTPTMRDINKKFSVRYYLNLVLVDEEDRRYFKQQEITLWRKGDRVRKSLLLHQQQGNPYHHQIPHAMARHNPGDYPSANVRTAPTPSEPNTPIAEPGSNYVPGIPSPHPPLPEEPLEQDDDDAEPPHQEVTATPQQTPRQKFHSNSSDVIEEVVENEEKVEEKEQPANKPSSSIEADEVAVESQQPQKPPTNETNNHVVESPTSNDEKNDLMQSKTKGSISTNDPPPPLEKSAVVVDDSKKTSPSMSDSSSKIDSTTMSTQQPEKVVVASEIVTPSSPSEAEILTEKMSKLDTKPSSSPSPPEAEETLFLPPEDDSVPDMDDSVSEQDDAAAVVDNDEDEDDPIGDDDL